EDCQVLGEASDAGDRAAPKALTGAYKYFLRQTFLIEAGDERADTPRQTRRPRPPTNPPPSRNPARREVLWNAWPPSTPGWWGRAWPSRGRRPSTSQRPGLSPTSRRTRTPGMRPKSALRSPPPRGSRRCGARRKRRNERSV